MAVKRYSNIGVLKAVAALSLLGAAVMGFGAALLWTLPRDDAPTWSIAACAGTIFVFLALALISLRAARSWSLRDDKRQAAVLDIGNPPPLASEQPAPRGTPLSSPSKIAELRMKLWFRPVVWVVVATACVAFAYNPDHGGPILGFSTCGFLAAALLAIHAAFLGTSSQYVTITDGGLAFASFRFTETITWDQATLFCIPRGAPYGPPRYFELSGPNEIVQWWRLRPDSPLSRIYEPAVSAAEYDAQLDALLSLIAARTGLPLYDLR